jgi:hypothetical protein
MAETVVIEEGNGSGPTWTPLTGIVGRYCTMDAYNPGTNNPCKVPTIGFNYSFWKSHSANVSGTFNSIRDIYWYCDGNVSSDWGLDSGNGGMLQIGKRDAGDNGCPVANYAQATGSVGQTGHSIADPTNGHPYYRGQSTPVINADTCTSSAPLLIDSTVYTAPFRSKIWNSQLKIPPTATHGEKAAKTFTISYNVY